MKKDNNMVISFVLVALVLLSRLIPHQPNFTPLISVILFSSMFFRGKMYIAIPLLALIFSDVLLQNFQGYSYIFSSTFFWTYGALFLIFFFSYNFNYKVSFRNVLLNSLLGAIIFFIVSNFGVWISSGGYYPFNLSGLISCYISAIPFFRNTLSSTMIYSLILFFPILFKSRIFIPKKSWHF